MQQVTRQDQRDNRSNPGEQVLRKLPAAVFDGEGWGVGADCLGVHREWRQLRELEAMIAAVPPLHANGRQREVAALLHAVHQGVDALAASDGATAVVQVADNGGLRVKAQAFDLRGGGRGQRQDGRIVGEHPRCYGRDQTIYDPWHYVPVLARKPGALRNGAPFKDWVLPGAIDRVRRKLAAVQDGDRQMVEILTAVLSDGLSAVEAACADALRQGVHSADVIINILARRREPAAAITIMTPDALRLHHEPAADCARYDSLRRAV